MTTVTPSLPDATSLSSSATSNFLSSLTSNLGADGILSGLFANLLATAQTVTVPQTDPSLNQPQVTSAPNNNANASLSPDTLLGSSVGTLNDITSALRNFSAKWHSQTSQNQNKQNSSQSQNTQPTATAPAMTSSVLPNASSGVTPPTSTSTTAPTTTNTSASTDPNAPPSLADLLAQLQSILHMLQKQIQLAQSNSSAGTSSTSANGGSNPSLQDMLAAGGAMGDLLALAQMIDKKIGQSTTTDPTQTSTSNTPVDPNLAALDAQLKADLKSLLDSFNQAVTANGSATATAETTSATATTDLNLLTTPSTTTASDTAVSTPDDIIKGALATVDDFLKQLNNLYSPAGAASNLTAAIKNDVIASTSGSNGSSLGSGQNGGAPDMFSTASTTNTQETSALPNSNDNVKSSNPYSFASQLSALRAQLGGTTGLQSPVEQVLLFMNRNAKSGNDQMSIQLHPAELGTINVKLAFANDGSVTGTIIANNSDTLAMLQKDSRSLERALQDAGLRADPGSLEFSLGNPSNNNSGQGTQNQLAGNSSSGANSNSVSTIAADAETTTTNSWVITPGRVNIQV